MENIRESLPPSWIVKTTVKTVKKNSVEVRSFFNEKTCQNFFTRKDLDRYVQFVKREIPEIYADWTTDNKKKGVKKQRSKKKKKVARTSKGVPENPLNKKRAKPEPDTAPDALAKEQLLKNAHKAVIVYSRRRKMAEAEAIKIPASSPAKAEPKDHVFYENIDLEASLAPNTEPNDQVSEMEKQVGFNLKTTKLYFEVDSESDALMDQVWEECDKMSWF